MGTTDFFQLDFNYSYYYGNASEIGFFSNERHYNIYVWRSARLKCGNSSTKVCIANLISFACMIFSLCHCLKLSNELFGASCKYAACDSIRKSVYITFSYASPVFSSIMQKLLNQIKCCCNFRIIFDRPKKVFIFIHYWCGFVRCQHSERH